MLIFLAFISLLTPLVLCLTPRQRAQALVAKMSLKQQLSLVRGYSGPYVGNVLAIPEHGIPALHLEDGPQGVADGTKLVTCWPSALTTVSTFDTRLMETYAAALGREQRVKGSNIMLGPMVNLARVPFGGRNFESFGEDPYLSSRMIVSNVKGIQSEGVLACMKHFILNNQENDRGEVSARVDPRTLHELYLRPFAAGVLAGVGSVMCSYNRVNDTHACENDATLNHELKHRLGFEGFVMSDWGGTHSTTSSANGGLDMEMPRDKYFGSALESAVAIGSVPKSRISDMAIRILTPMFDVGLMDTPQRGNLSVDAMSAAHTELARRIAEQAAVLVKNDRSLLPLDSGKKIKIAVIGDDGSLHPTATGGGSGHVICPYVVTPLEGIKGAVIDPKDVTYVPTAPISAAVAAAVAADVAVVFVATDSSEGRDRKTLALGGNQDELVRAVSKAQRNTIVVVHTPAAVTMPWIGDVASVVVAWLPGQEDGTAIANVLFGKVNPFARLPVTFPMNDTQNPLRTKMQYPGVWNPKTGTNTVYSEKLLIGYRWYDQAGETPLFPFGHGLSYTSFQYGPVAVVGSLDRGHGTVRISVDVTNSGNRDGREVVQMYLGFPASAGEPPKVLSGFENVAIARGQKETVTFDVNWGEEVSVWDTDRDDWRVIGGTFSVFVGASSRDIRGHGKFVVSL